jgi:hypothetical protein
MATPWCIEFNKDILIVIDDKIFEVLSYNNFNWFIISDRYFLAFEVSY